MGRPVVLTVEAYREFETQTRYTAEVQDVRPAGENLEVALRCRDRSQEGRVQVVLIPARVLPQSLTGRFFAACGFDISVGAVIRPKDARGRVVKVVFRRSDGNGVEVDRFESIHSEAKHEPDTQPSDAPFS